MLLPLLVTVLTWTPLGALQNTVSWRSSEETALAADAVSSLVPLLRRAVPQGQNALLSPLSVAAVLAALDMGARGQSHRQLVALLHPVNTGAPVHVGIGDILREVNVSREAQLASAVFVDSSLQLNELYSAYTKALLASDAFNVDFRRDPQAAADQVNRWVSLKTRGKIGSILPAVSADTSVVLASALYFHGSWMKPFPRDGTARRPFTVNPGEVLLVDMMANTTELPYADHPELQCQVVSLPYSGGEYAMYVLLPYMTGERALGELESRLTPQKLSSALKSVKVQTVDLSMPRFKLESSVDLKEALAAAGVVDIFDPSRSDLSGILDSNRCGGGCPAVSVGALLHKVLVEVTEEGTEAAAATATTVDRFGVRATSFHVNHPFLFVIQHLPTKAVLFWGSVVRPSPSYPA